MTTLTIKTTEGKRVVEFPDNWNELTVRQGIEIEALDKVYPLQILSILTGLDLEVIEQQSAKLEIQALVLIQKILTNVPDWANLPAPKQLKVGDKLIDIPKVEELTLGQSIMFTEYISGNSVKDFVPHALAIYLQSVIDGKFDRHRIPVVKELLMDCKLVEAVGVLNFFLRNLKGSSHITSLALHLFQTVQSKPTYLFMKSLESSYG